MSTKKKRAPVHPGEILKEEFLIPLALSANQLALALHVPPGRLTQIINGQRSVTADTALRLAKYFGTSAELWLNLQSYYELELARDRSATVIDEQVRPRQCQDKAIGRRTASGGSAVRRSEQGKRIAG